MPPSGRELLPTRTPALQPFPPLPRSRGAGSDLWVLGHRGGAGGGAQANDPCEAEGLGGFELPRLGPGRPLRRSASRALDREAPARLGRQRPETPRSPAITPTRTREDPLLLPPIFPQAPPRMSRKIQKSRKRYICI